MNTTVDYYRQNYETILSQFTPQQVNAFKQIPEIRNLTAWLTYIENTLAGTSAAAQIPVQLRQYVANIQQFCANDELRTAFNTTFRATLTTNQEQTRLNQKAQQIHLLANVLRDDADQTANALGRLANDPNLAAAGAAGWRWGHVIFAERVGVPRANFLTDADLAAPIIDPVTGQPGQPGDPKRLSGGQITTVWSLQYQNIAGRMVFKQNEVRNTAPGKIPPALDKLNIQTAQRALAASRMDALIHSKLPQGVQGYGLLLGNTRPAIYTRKIGMAVSFAPGSEAMISRLTPGGAIKWQAYLNVDITDPDLQRWIANLQLLDIVNGEIDRHMANVMVVQATGTPSRVTGIDNDFCFSHVSNTLHTNTANTGQAKTMLPVLIDKLYAQAVLAVTQQEITLALQGLRDVEVGAALQRIAALQQHLQGLAANHQLIALPGQAAQGERSWDQILIQDFAPPPQAIDFHYAWQLAQPREAASQEIANRHANGTLSRALVVKQGRKMWQYNNNPHYLMARDRTHGTDLTALFPPIRIGTRGR